MNSSKGIVKTVLTILITAIVTAVTVLFAVNLYLSKLPIPIDNVIRVSEIINKDYMGEYNPILVKGIRNCPPCA